MSNILWKGKKILVMGLGLYGGGSALAAWLVKQGARVRITDLKTAKELSGSIQKLPHNKGIQFTLGRHDFRDFMWADMVVQNPGVPKESKFLMFARQSGVLIENEATLFFKIIGMQRIVGVTGTRGKSTTASLIFALLKTRYPHTLFGGNIGTYPMFSIIDKAKKYKDPVVLELSSWHLENLGEYKLSPHVAVFTNLYPDHLNRYRSMEEYGEAKQSIFRFQTPLDYVVFNWDNPYTLSFGQTARSEVWWFSRRKNIDTRGSCIKDGWICALTFGKTEKITEIKNIAIAGKHNTENVLAAVCVAKIFGVSMSRIAGVLKQFRGLSHRLEAIRTFRGVRYINDTAATTPDATLAGLKTLGVGKNRIILIAGGSDKGIPQEKFNDLGNAIRSHCKALVLVEGEGSKKIYSGLGMDKAGKKIQVVAFVSALSDAFGVANQFTKPGDIVLLSPACASFGIFSNSYERGNQFRKLVLGLRT